MRLPIETWLAESDLPQEAGIAFHESVTCFKAGAYRAALLFGYIGWSLCIRNRILNAQKPSKITAGQWQSIATNLRDDAKWDNQAFDCIQMQRPAPIFTVADDLRTQVRYWRDRRNDCAHFKLNTISSSHVESFWAFVQANLGRFVPFGSEEDLLARFERHFDSNYTAPGTDVRPLVERIPESVESVRLIPFLEAVVQRFSSERGGKTSLRSSELAEIFGSILRTGTPTLTAAAVQVSASHLSLFLALLRQDPASCLNWSTDATLIRRLWRELLFKNGKQDLPVFAALLRNLLIPLAEKADANRHVALRLNGDVPSSDDVSALKDAGFFDAFKAVAFAEMKVNEFGWANLNAAGVRWYVENFPIDSVVGKALCSTFSGSPYPFKARRELRLLMVENQVKRKELEDVATQLNEKFPEALLQGDEED
jgi:hypothetical protein